MGEQHQTINSKPSYLWDKRWVRPYESLWSIIRNFRIVNGACSYNMFFYSLGIRKNATTVRYIDLDYAVYQTIPNYQDAIDKISDKLLPSDYQEDIKPISRYLLYASEALSLKLRFCPQCIKEGYHSYFHQLSGLSTCIFHPNEKLLVDYDSSYLIGQDMRFALDKNDRDYMKRFCPPILGKRNLCDLRLEENLILPFMWKEIPINRKAILGELYTVYDIFSSIASSYVSINRESYMGAFLFKDRCKMLPMVSIYDRASSDVRTVTLLEKDYISQLNGSGAIITEKLWIIIVANMIKGLIEEYSEEEIEFKEYQIYSGKKLKRQDILAAKLLFIWKYIGFKTIDLSLKFGIYNYREEPDRYHPKINSPICIRCTSWESIIHNYGISVTWHVINLHFRYCYKMFLKCIQRECNYNNGYFSIESDIDYFNAPTYFIEKKSDVINIYSY